jgi:hypothetical protein
VEWLWRRRGGGAEADRRRTGRHEGRTLTEGGRAAVAAFGCNCGKERRRQRGVATEAAETSGGLGIGVGIGEGRGCNRSALRFFSHGAIECEQVGLVHAGKRGGTGISAFFNKNRGFSWLAQKLLYCKSLSKSCGKLL